jgi:hypothetical protein
LESGKNRKQNRPAWFIKLNNIYGEGPAAAVSFLTAIAGITNADPSRQFQFLLRILF